MDNLNQSMHKNSKFTAVTINLSALCDWCRLFQRILCIHIFRVNHEAAVAVEAEKIIAPKRPEHSAILEDNKDKSNIRA